MQVNAYNDAGIAYDRAAQAAVPAARPAFAEHARRARFYSTKGAFSAAEVHSKDESLNFIKI